MTPADRAAVRARCEAATPGPWTWNTVPIPTWRWLDHGPNLCSHGGDVLRAWGYDGSGLTANPTDLDFIAHARTDLPAALDEIERLEEAVETVHAVADAAHAEVEQLTRAMGYSPLLSCCRDAASHVQHQLDALAHERDEARAALRLAKKCIVRLAPPSVAPDDDSEGWAAIEVLQQIDAALEGR